MKQGFLVEVFNNPSSRNIRLALSLLFIMLVTIVVMAIFAVAKVFLDPDITVWETQVYTTIFTGIIAPLIALFVLLRFERLYEQVSHENEARKLVEEELKDAKAQAELYLDLMGHDINNYNQVALGYLELIESKVEDEELKDLISKPLDAVSSSSYLIENVRKLQKYKKHEYKAMAVDLNEILSRLRAQYSNVQDKDVTINYTNDSCCMVMADGLIKDVFSNLVWNAIKHSNGSSVHINLVLERHREDGREYCKVIVEDDGPGIPDTQKEKLFARFQRGDTRASGKGLGLYLVKTLVEGYQGRVWLEDRVQGDHTKGAKFVVMLPAIEK